MAKIPRSMTVESSLKKFADEIKQEVPSIEFKVYYFYTTATYNVFHSVNFETKNDQGKLIYYEIRDKFRNFERIENLRRHVNFFPDAYIHEFSKFSSRDDLIEIENLGFCEKS